MADYTNDDVESVAAKIAGLELSDGEKAALDAVFTAAERGGTEPAEVEGFGSRRPLPSFGLPDLRVRLIQIAPPRTSVVINHEEQ